MPKDRHLQSFKALDATMDALKERLADLDDRSRADFQEKFLISWLYHDNALEGVVLTYHEIKAAIDDRIISDSTLIPMYDELIGHKAAIDLVFQEAKKKRHTISLEFLRKLHELLTTEEEPEYHRYRKDNPLHRLYFHEILPPEKISYHMKKMVEWTRSTEYKKMHPINKAAQLHLTLITIYPWIKHSGKVARLLMNYVLIRHGYVPAVIHAVDRQRYYDILRSGSYVELAELIKEALQSAMESTKRYLTELAPQRRPVFRSVR